MPNEFSPTWFETFLAPSTAAPVDRELEFVRTHLPLNRFPRLLDVPCGIGRHANPLAHLGYDVLGVDRSEAALEVARRASVAGATFRCLDMNNLDSVEETFDGVLCLWASFGYGTAQESEDLLRSMSRRLRQGGRLVLDVYNAAAFAVNGEESVVRGGRTVTTHRELVGHRMHVHLRYSDSSDTDSFDWLVYTPAQLIDVGAAAGLNAVFACAWFDQQTPPGPNHQRMQILLEKR